MNDRVRVQVANARFDLLGIGQVLVGATRSEDVLVTALFEHGQQLPSEEATAASDQDARLRLRRHRSRHTRV